MKPTIRLLYLYLFSFVGLIIVVIGTVRIIDLGIKTMVFKGSDVYNYSYPKAECPPEGECNEISGEELMRNAENEAIRQRQRELSGSLSMIIVGLPLYLYHWNIIKKENKDKKFK